MTDLTHIVSRSTRLTAAILIAMAFLEAIKANHRRPTPGVATKTPVIIVVAVVAMKIIITGSYATTEGTTHGSERRSALISATPRNKPRGGSNRMILRAPASR